MTARVRTSPRAEPVVVEVALDDETRSYAFFVRKLNIAGGAATLPRLSPLRWRLSTSPSKMRRLNLTMVTRPVLGVTARRNFHSRSPDHVRSDGGLT